MNDFMFNYIFNNEKDKAFFNAKVFRIYLERTYGIKDIKMGTDLYIAINRYQVKKYGCSVNPNDFIDLSKETLRRKAKIRMQSKRKRTRG